MRFKIFMLVVCFEFASTCDTNTATMLASYATNERKPTAVALYNLCCNSTQQVKLQRAITTAGFCVTSSIPELETSSRTHELLVIADLDCPLALLLLLEAVKKKWMKAPLRWLVLRDASNLQRHEDPRYQELKSWDILVDSDLVIAERMEVIKFEFVEVHKHSPSSPAVETHRGWWSAGVLHDTRTHREHYRRRWNLKRIPLTISNVVVDSNDTKIHLPMEDRLYPNQDTFPKMVWSIGRLGLEMLNATPLYSFADSWGFKDTHGNWTGVINDVATGKSVLGTSCLFTRERFEVIDFVAMVAPVKLRFIMRQPPLSYVSNIYTLPFSIGVWLSTIVCVFASAVALLFASKWEAALEKSPNQLSGSATDVFLLAMSAVCQQGCVLEPRKASGRIMTLILFLALMALYIAYSANIVVLLHAPSNAINNLRDLYNSKVTMAANDLVYNRYLFQNEKGLRRAIYEQRLAPAGGKSNYYHIDEGVKRLRQGLFAFHSITDPVYRLIEETFLESEKCDLVEVAYIDAIDPWLPMQKGSPYKELFQVVFKQIQEAGIPSAIIKRLRVPKPKCPGTISSFNSVGITEFYPAVLFMMYGFGLAVAILVLEIIIYGVIKKRRENKVFTTPSTKTKNENTRR